MSREPIHILGAGIGGLTSAITLARHGREIILHERKHVIGGSFSRTVHGIRNYENLFLKDAIEFFTKDLGLHIADSYHPINTLRRYSSSGYNYVMRNERAPILYNFLRGSTGSSLEQELLAQALALGVQVNYGAERNPRDCQIIATGSRYCDFVGYSVHYECVRLDDYDEVRAFFSSKFAPKGYAYILPFKDKSATIGIVALKKYVTKSPETYHAAFLDHLATVLGLDVSERNAVSIDSGIGHYNLYNSFQIGETLFVGAVAGLVTADYGLALKNAILSGYLAAKSMLTGSSYNRLIMEQVYPELASAYLKRLSMSRYGSADLDKKIRKQAQQTPSVLVNSAGLDNSVVYSFVARILSNQRRRKYPLLLAASNPA